MVVDRHHNNGDMWAHVASSVPTSIIKVYLIEDIWKFNTYTYTQHFVDGTWYSDARSYFCPPPLGFSHPSIHSSIPTLPT
jgi:hypothetical protein